MLRPLLVLILISCAHRGPKLIEQSELRPYQEYAEVTFAKEKTEELGAITVKDERSDKSALGVAYVGLSYQKTPVILYKSADEFLKDYFFSALTQRNVEFSEGSPTQLEITIKKLELNEVIEKFKPEVAVCEVELSFRFHSADKSATILSRSKITSPGDFQDGTDRLGPTLSSCLNEVTETLIKSEDLYKVL